jgi:streptogramin lyase
MSSKVDPNVLWKTPGKQPNGLQATPEGLWVIDQIDPNDIYLLDYDSGRELTKIPTRAIHSSGITIDPTGNIWVSSTFTYELICFDRQTGKELVAHRTPPYDQSGGAHGIEWHAGQLWFSVPITGKIFVMDPANGQILSSIPCHGDRAHGLAWEADGSGVWSVDTNKRVVYKLNPATGEILNAVGCTGPEPHGMTIWQGNFWICDAETRDVCTFAVPRGY